MSTLKVVSKHKRINATVIAGREEDVSLMFHC
jgi:hypothetical protein